MGHDRLLPRGDREECRDSGKRKSRTQPMAVYFFDEAAVLSSDLIAV